MYPLIFHLQPTLSLSKVRSTHRPFNDKLLLPSWRIYRCALAVKSCDIMPLSLGQLCVQEPFDANKIVYYMTSSVSGQDVPNRALWLATRAGKMERYCPLGISRLVPQDQRSFFGVLSHIINPLLTKIVRSRWLDIGLVLFLRVYGPRLRLGP